MIDRDYEGSRTEFLRMLAEQGEEPAFVTRRRKLDASMEQLRSSCKRQRRELLHGPRLHLRRIASSLQGDWSKLAPHLAVPSEWGWFESTGQEMNQLSPAPAWSNPGWSFGSVGGPLREFRDSVDRFNARWLHCLGTIDLSVINQEINDYNAYYVLEKACAFGREDIAARGFRPIDELDATWLKAEFPPITMPHLANLA